MLEFEKCKSSKCTRQNHKNTCAMWLSGRAGTPDTEAAVMALIDHLFVFTQMVKTHHLSCPATNE